jgi:PQQ-dependent catabolism-associated CXXCW motif protein
MTSLKIFLFSLVAALAFSAQSITVQKQGSTVFATGSVGDDVRKFEEAFASGGVDTVVFVNSPGGDLWTGLRVGRLIAEKGYRTVIAGSCISACSIMFMGGKNRQFSDALRPNLTFIGIHGAHNSETKQINPIVQPQIFAFYKQFMGEKFNADVMNQALYDMDDAGSMLRVFDPHRSINTLPYHCKSSQTQRDKCTKFEGKNALNLGIVTDASLMKIELPSAFKANTAVFGHELSLEVAEMAALLGTIADSKCPMPICKTNVTNFAERKENRALATAISTIGLGLSNDVDTPSLAVIRALYNCNHPSGGAAARLCEAKIVNGFDLSDHYAQSDASHAKLLAEIKKPTDKFYANEEFGGNFTKAEGLRREKLNDITPQSIDGINTIGTQELASRLQTEAAQLTVIDVMGFFETIPSAKALLNSGAAFANTAQDDAFEKRFSGLLNVLVPDKASAIVFFCGNRNCWHSANAAMRAKTLGYSQVHWYRGGVEAWKAAGLPLAAGAVRAVAHQRE